MLSDDLVDGHEQIMEDRSQRLKRLCYLYLRLLSHGFEKSVLRLPATLDPDDRNYVCEIVFLIEDDIVEIEVDLQDGINDYDDIRSFLIRAESFMRQTLRLYQTSQTSH